MRTLTDPMYSAVQMSLQEVALIPPIGSLWPPARVSRNLLERNMHFRVFPPPLFLCCRLTPHPLHLDAALEKRTRPEIVSSLGLNGTTGFIVSERKGELGIDFGKKGRSE